MPLHQNRNDGMQNTNSTKNNILCVKFFPRYTIESNRPKQKKEIEKDNVSIVVFQG
jgi:hypothetical protein